MSLNWQPWAAVHPGIIRPAPGSPVTAVFYPSFPGGIALFVANSDGEVYATAGIPQEKTWKEWKTVAQGATTPGAPVTAVPWGEEFALFVADRGGEVFATGGAPPTQRAPESWGPWATVRQGSTTPGARVTAVPWGEEFALFVADRGGGVYTTGGDPQGGFGPWATVSQGSTTPGAPVTAVLDPNTGVPITLFLTDPNGGIYTSSGNPQGGFGSWSYVNPASGPDFRAAPGSPVTAHATGPGLLTAFATRTDGFVSFTSRIGDSWAGWAQIPGITLLPRTPITEAAPSALLRTLFAADIDGRVMTSAGASGNWEQILDGTTAPGSLVTAYYEGGFTISVFVTGTDGQVQFTRATNLVLRPGRGGGRPPRGQPPAPLA